MPSVIILIRLRVTWGPPPCLLCQCLRPPFIPIFGGRNCTGLQLPGRQRERREGDAAARIRGEHEGVVPYLQRGLQAGACGGGSERARCSRPTVTFAPAPADLPPSELPITCTLAPADPATPVPGPGTNRSCSTPKLGSQRACSNWLATPIGFPHRLLSAMCEPHPKP
jgi:hypothetical protein